MNTFVISLFTLLFGTLHKNSENLFRLFQNIWPKVTIKIQWFSKRFLHHFLKLSVHFLFIMQFKTKICSSSFLSNENCNQNNTLSLHSPPLCITANALETNYNLYGLTTIHHPQFMQNQMEKELVQGSKDTYYQ